MRVKRESNIELLRILAICAVMVLHYNAGRGFNYTTSIFNYNVLCILESVCICAVDLFILISGYFLCETQKRDLGKMLELYVQLVFVRVGFYLFSVVQTGSGLDIKTVLKLLIPNDYFVILYMVVYIVSPYINIVMKSLDENQRKKMLITLLLLFSVWPTAVDLSGEILGKEWFGLSSIGAYGSQYGISLINFLLLYIVGAYLRLNKVDEKIQRKIPIVIGIVICVTGIFLWSCVNERLTAIGLRSAWVYHNPLVILEAVLYFLLFKKMKLESNVVNCLAKGTFMCYLVHLNLIDYFKISEAVNGSAVRMILHVISVIVILYLISYVVYLIYRLLLGHFFEKLSIPLYSDLKN